MGKARRGGWVLTCTVVCALVLIGSWNFHSRDANSGNSNSGTAAADATVQHVVDGDTVYVLIEGKRTKVRLLNVDAPEIAHRDRAGECFGKEAADYLSDRLPRGATVQLEFDAERQDRYGRTLARVSHNGESINEALIASGHATAMKVPPNVRFYDGMRSVERQAHKNKVGMFDPAAGCQ